jgi:hypothetical protein
MTDGSICSNGRWQHGRWQHWHFIITPYRASKFEVEEHAPCSQCRIQAEEQEHATIRKTLKTALMTSDNDVTHTQKCNFGGE